MIRPAFGILLLAGASVALIACDEKLSTLAGPTPNLEPTFASIQRDIFEATDAAGRTACTQCHSNTGRAPSGGLNLNHDVAYDQLVNAAVREKPGAVRVVPGDPDNSYLVQKLEGTSAITGRRMPQNGPPYLTDGQIAIIRRWIALGAPRN
jgi:Planctomycete cytochrome C